MLFELATEILEQYGRTGEGFVKLFDCERDKNCKWSWADFLEDQRRARREGIASI